MIIECPACKTRAKLPDSKEGAKVRCPECQRVFVARPPGAAPRSKQDPTKYVLIGVGVVAFCAIMFMYNKSGGDEQTIVVAEEPEPEDTGPVGDTTGWDSPLVKLTRDLHDLAFKANTVRLRSLVDGKNAWAHRKALEEEAGSDEVRAHWDDTPGDQQLLFATDLVDELVNGAAKELVADWVPYDIAGDGGLQGVIENDGEFALVRLAVNSREDPTLPARGIEWRLAHVNGTWRAYHWERWISEAEQAASRVRTSKKTTRKTLSDGSEVIEGEIRPIPYMDETTAEARAEIDGALATALDLSLPPRQTTPAKNTIIEYGKHAIPALLTKFAEIPISDDMDDLIRLQLVGTLLEDITGYPTTFQAHEALGATVERRDSGVKQWFGWYDRKFKRFTQKEESEEALLEFLSDEDRANYEKAKREAEARKRLGG